MLLFILDTWLCLGRCLSVDNERRVKVLTHQHQTDQRDIRSVLVR